MSTTNDRPVWDAERIAQFRATLETVNALPSLLDELGRVRQERDENEADLLRLRTAEEAWRARPNECAEVEKRLDYVAQCFHVALHGVRAARLWTECEQPTCRQARGA